MEIIISKLNKSEQPPYELLLEADPSIDKINEYIDLATVFLAKDVKRMIGIIVIVSRDEASDEIVNLAVSQQYRRRGIAKQLIAAACEHSQKSGKSELYIGTGNSSIHQLALYQKCGFRLDCIKKNYFLDHYEEEIYENGIQCMDMIMLQKRLKIGKK